MSKRKRSAEVANEGPIRRSARRSQPLVEVAAPPKSQPKAEPPTKKKGPAKKAVAVKKAPVVEKRVVIEKVQPKDAPVETLKPASGGAQYWLMKAEPESRLENGVDVKFSIDDLASKTKPEPWDGIRAYPARNNLRAMKKGDLAFFYHSSCKEPGIVGVMEIVEEHSPDWSAYDPKAPYYDASAKPDDPKWSVVHVKFKSKLAVPIGLKELRTLATPGKPLEAMQMLKLSRLSVSRVSPAEWEFLTALAGEKEKELAAAA